MDECRRVRRLFLVALLGTGHAGHAYAADEASSNASPRTGRGAEQRQDPALQELGELTIADRYGKKTSIDVSFKNARQPTSRLYTTGDRIDDAYQVLAVRIGEHVGVVKSGALWSFPLHAGTSGSAVATFDDKPEVGQISWRVAEAGKSSFLIEADVIIPISYSAQTVARLTGKWKAEFDSTFPIPSRAELAARMNLYQTGSNENTVTTWAAHP